MTTRADVCSTIFSRRVTSRAVGIAFGRRRGALLRRLPLLYSQDGRGRHQGEGRAPVRGVQHNSKDAEPALRVPGKTEKVQPPPWLVRADWVRVDRHRMWCW